MSKTGVQLKVTKIDFNDPDFREQMEIFAGLARRRIERLAQPESRRMAWERLRDTVRRFLSAVWRFLTHRG
jgi:hypothetical protein